jgi:hypothetical protein
MDGLPAAQFYDGQFEFSDQAFNPLLRIHGDVEPSVIGVEPGVTCAQFKKAELLSTMTSGFEGVYRTQPKTGTGSQGTFAVGVADGGEPATISGDFICISLEGAFEYLDCGLVQGGDLQVD